MMCFLCLNVLDSLLELVSHADVESVILEEDSADGEITTGHFSSLASRAHLPLKGEQNYRSKGLTRPKVLSQPILSHWISLNC